MLLLDTCQSGGMLVAMRSMAEKRALTLLAKSYGIHILAATTEKQYAMEVKDIGHGIFIHAILEGLEGRANSNNDGIITVRELLPYVENRVPELSEKYYSQRQYPVTDSRGMDFPVGVK